MIRVELQELNGLYVIASHPTHITYTFQCGGYICRNNEMEGFLVSLEYTEPAEEALYDYFFNGPKYMGHCYNGIDTDDADQIEEILRIKENGWATNWIKVDRTRLNDSVESWIYIRPEEGSHIPYCYNYPTDPNSEMVLIWNNSD